MKIVAAVIARRISHVFESEHFLADGEAGLRPEEECVCQVGALIEILQRWTLPMREAKGGKILEGDESRAYACFVDFKRAYDMVPMKQCCTNYELTGYRVEHIILSEPCMMDPLLVCEWDICIPL